MNRRLRLVAVAALAAGSLMAGCGGGDDGAGGGDPFDLALDFYVNPDHAGIYEGIDRGFFADAGLDVNPLVPSDPSAPIKQVAAGRVDLAISYEPEVMLARDQGLDVVAVGALVNGPLTSLISLPEGGIEQPSDLAGKTVVTAGIPYQAAYLQTILADAGVDPDSVDQVDVGFNLMPPLIAGRADAMFGGFLNVEGVDLAERGLDPRVVPVNELGVPTYDELVLVADADRLRDDPEPIREFLAALEQGTAAAERDPGAATQTLLDARRRPRSRPHQGRGRRHPPPPRRPRRRPLRLHGPEGVGALLPLPGRQRPHRRLAAGKRAADERPAAAG